MRAQLVVIGLLLAACGREGLSSSSPVIEVVPLALDFDPVPTGLEVSLPVQVRNLGKGTLELSAARVDGRARGGGGGGGSDGNSGLTANAGGAGFIWTYCSGGGGGGSSFVGAVASAAQVVAGTDRTAGNTAEAVINGNGAAGRVVITW